MNRRKISWPKCHWHVRHVTVVARFSMISWSGRADCRDPRHGRRAAGCNLINSDNSSVSPLHSTPANKKTPRHRLTQRCLHRSVRTRTFPTHCNDTFTAVTGQSIPPTGLYHGVYSILGYFILPGDHLVGGSLRPLTRVVEFVGYRSRSNKLAYDNGEYG